MILSKVSLLQPVGRCSMSSPDPSLLQTEQSLVPNCLCNRGAPALGSSLCSSSEITSECPDPSHILVPRTAHGSSCGSHQSRGMGRILTLQLLPTLLWMQPRTQLVSGLNAHSIGVCPVFHPQVLLVRATLSPFSIQTVLLRIAPTHVQQLAKY